MHAANWSLAYGCRDVKGTFSSCCVRSGDFTYTFRGLVHSIVYARFHSQALSLSPSSIYRTSTTCHFPRSYHDGPQKRAYGALCVLWLNLQALTCGPYYFYGAKKTLFFGQWATAWSWFWPSSKLKNRISLAIELSKPNKFGSRLVSKMILSIYVHFSKNKRNMVKYLKVHN